jgi:hypothetical protein
MNDDGLTPLTLSREDLYELTWSKPLSELAKDFGISDVALAKRCRRLGIPVPGRGYWARVDAGQNTYRPQLPEREPQWHDNTALTVAPSQDAPPPHFNGSPSEPESSRVSQEDPLQREREHDQAWLNERTAFEERPENAIAVPRVTRKWNSAIKGCHDDLEHAAEEMQQSRKASDRHDKMPEWQRRAANSLDGYKWRSARDNGQRLVDTHKAVAFRVSLDTYKRALRLTNALALAAASRGFTVCEDKKIGRLVFSCRDAKINMRVTELLDNKTRPRVRYDGKSEQETYEVPTGRLRISLEISHHDGPSFEDRDSRTLDTQLNRIFLAIYRLVLKAWKREREHQEFRRRFEEDRRRRTEEARVKAEREKTLAEERASRERLLAEANSWAESHRIRRYIAHIRSTAIARACSSDRIDNWLEWALRVAADHDPTDKRLAGENDDRVPSSEWLPS